ncbi:hypothetical protein RBB84_18955 [Rhodococcus sp. D-6]|uniref:Uncharacterized protein n=1 Tax=Rhodococcus sp. D-6 TaxID=1387842 RepID=A0AAU7UTU6_9NOCA
MAHLPYTVTRRPAELAVHRRTHLHVVRPAVAPRPTLEEELLARLDTWMAHHPTSASIVAGGSVVALMFLAAYAVVVSSI